MKINDTYNSCLRLPNSPDMLCKLILPPPPPPTLTIDNQLVTSNFPQQRTEFYYTEISCPKTGRGHAALQHAVPKRDETMQHCNMPSQNGTRPCNTATCRPKTGRGRATLQNAVPKRDETTQHCNMPSQNGTRPCSTATRRPKTGRDHTTLQHAVPKRDETMQHCNMPSQNGTRPCNKKIFVSPLNFKHYENNCNHSGN